VGVAKRAEASREGDGEAMNPLLFLQQALRGLGSRGRSVPIDITDLDKPLDLLTRKIQMMLLMAIRDGATEIRYVPNDQYIQVLLTAKDAVQEAVPLPLFKHATAPIARRFRRMLQGTRPKQDDDAVESGTIYVGVHPVHLGLSLTPSDHGDILIVGINDPGLKHTSTHRHDSACDDQCVVVLEGAGEDDAPPSFESAFDSSEALWRWCCENLPPEEYNLSDG
jgi:hypothetical protein